MSRRWMISMAELSDWVETWQPMIDAIGTDFDAEAPLVWGERIDRSMLDRYLEPLEFDCALHADEAVAEANGYAGLVVPCTALIPMSVPLMWRPGEPPIFQTHGRNDLPARTAISGKRCGLEPETTHTFAVEWDMDFIAPATVGDRLCRRGLVLLACLPKRTRMGCGAFITTQSEIINERQQVLARVRAKLYRFNPHPTPVAEMRAG